MMFSWLRDTLANTSSSLSYSHSMIPSHFFRQRQQQQQRQRHKPNHSFSPSDDDDATDDETNDHSFYHNPYHSSGLMNYTDVPQQQYVNEHNYPTFLAQQSTNQLDNQSIDEQIHQKLLSLQQRGNRIQTYAQRQYNYLNRTSSISNENRSEQQIDHEIDTEEKTNENSPDDFLETNRDINSFYPGEYPKYDDEHFDLASVVLWYRNVMRSVKNIM